MLSLTAPAVIPPSEITALAAAAPKCEVWVGGPAASQLLTSARAGMRYIAALTDIVPMLDRHAR